MANEMLNELGAVAYTFTSSFTMTRNTQGIDVQSDILQIPIWKKD